MQAQISEFAKRYAMLGAQRMAIKMNKINQYHDTINICRSWNMPPTLEAMMRQVHGPLSKNMQAGWAKKAAQ